MSHTPRTMLDIARRQAQAVAKQAPRAGMRQADLLYMLEVLASIEDVLLWITDNEAILTKNAKGDVPWRASTR